MLAPVLAGAGEPPTPPVGRTRLALDHLAAAATAWHEGFQCGGCHKLPLTIAALSVARANGHDAPPPGTVAELVERLLDSDDRQDAQGCFSLDGQGITMATTYTARGMEAYDRHFDAKLRASLQAAAECLLGRQEADGRLTADLDGPPPSQGSFVTTANGALAWARAFELDGNPAYGNAANGAVAWLRSRIPTIEASPATFTTQDKAMLLMGLATAGTGPTDPDALLVEAQELDRGGQRVRHGSGRVRSARDRPGPQRPCARGGPAMAAESSAGGRVLAGSLLDG
jgi:hypothetical protein